MSVSVRVPEMVTITAREYEHLKDRVSTLEARCGHLTVDADRREERARAHAESCAEHGKEITYLRHLSSWYWAAAQHADQARRAIVMAIINTRMGLQEISHPLTADLVTWLDKLTAAQGKVTRRAPGYPSLADCLRAGGCEHDGLSPDLAAEIAAALGLPQPPQ